ncbi:uncharacterized protein MYCFIDRAFT_170715 [Pseudocercospora fijiensis CIRAD86]|uniref:Uncharacterized protein n=1 Tax=Pseudocercospora fijiensis (strain CIRAD86) TaxID=383855 RepID=N1QCE7_PSEFD|nr:uncharacterized protein MYCFIDRAFT_170715 [Pseudocercospora fijiensis CIRAD86]EME89212.1 hypothetical protein MYCFIDRAFT_170715 [Pseudocercospora fijiensis CIRAD86]
MTTWFCFDLHMISMEAQVWRTGKWSNVFPAPDLPCNTGPRRASSNSACDEQD